MHDHEGSAAKELPDTDQDHDPLDELDAIPKGFGVTPRRGHKRLASDASEDRRERPLDSEAVALTVDGQEIFAYTRTGSALVRSGKRLRIVHGVKRDPADANRVRELALGALSESLGFHAAIAKGVVGSWNGAPVELADAQRSAVILQRTARLTSSVPLEEVRQRFVRQFEQVKQWATQEGIKPAQLETLMRSMAVAWQ